MYALRINSTNSKADPDLDVSDALLASMELGNSASTSGCKGPLEELPPHIQPYWKLRNDLHCVDYVPMYNGRTIIPTNLQKQALEVLHSAHQGVLSMGLRAEDSVYWPGLWKDLERVRIQCTTCHTIA